MTDTQEQMSQLLREASETHHRVFRIVDAADGDWASWYAWWLINLSELPTVLDATPVRSELIHLLVNQNKQRHRRAVRRTMGVVPCAPDSRPLPPSRRLTRRPKRPQ